MCGILGCISNKEIDIQNGLDVMEHRGPDSEGLYKDNKVQLGFRRLAIIDLDEKSNQPFHLDNNILIFNGEIYNFQELKKILIEEGVEFSTKGDTEVLLLWLINKGIDAINEVEGMFSFAWYNLDTSELYLCRDSIGIKPLYVYTEENTIIFSSEIKSIFASYPASKKVDSSCIAEYLLNGFIYEPETGFQNIRKVAQGSYELYDLNATCLKKHKYWDLLDIPAQKNNSDLDIATEIDKSIKGHLISDVPVGLFFSGGIDSSIILTQTKSSILPMTVKSSEKEYKAAGMTSDYAYAMKIGKLLDIEVEAVELEDKNSSETFLEKVEKVAIGNEELMADFTFQSSQMLSQKARDKDFVVMISGMGADEIFAGYPRYKFVKYDSIFRLAKPLVSFLGNKSKWLAKKVERFNNYYAHKDFGMKYTSLIGFYSDKEVSSLLGNVDGLDKYKEKINAMLKPVRHYSKLRKALYLDFYGFLAHNFTVADKSSMQASIELRVPLATKKLYELTWRLKDSRLVSFLRLKKPLRSYLLKYIPKEIVDRTKAGFNPPLDSYINELGAEKIYATFKEHKLFDTINEKDVNDLIKVHFNKERNNTYKLYQLLHLTYWLKNYS